MAEEMTTPPFPEGNTGDAKSRPTQMELSSDKTGTTGDALQYLPLGRIPLFHDLKVSQESVPGCAF